MVKTGKSHTQTLMHSLDIIIPVYEEGENIIESLETIRSCVKTPSRVLLCYDHEEDSTLKALRTYKNAHLLDLRTVKNQGRGAAEAVFSGIAASEAPAVLVYCADDFENAKVIDAMYAEFAKGCQIVVGSRFIKGGCMVGFPLLKATLVHIAAFTLYHFARISTKDPTNGIRIYSRKLLQEVPIESRIGWAFNLEFLVKSERSGAKIGEVAYRHFERTRGASKFKVLQWLPHYLKWYLYAFATVFSGPVVFTADSGSCTLIDAEARTEKVGSAG